MKNNMRSGLRRGFTLIELTVVILIIGIVATIAAPKFFDSVTSAKNKSAQQTIEVVRDALELYRANNSAYPGQATVQATMKTELAPYLRKEFPTIQVGKNNSNIKFVTADPVAVTTDTEAWVYNKATGEIRINHADYITY